MWRPGAHNPLFLNQVRAIGGFPVAGLGLKIEYDHAGTKHGLSGHIRVVDHDYRSGDFHGIGIHHVAETVQTAFDGEEAASVDSLGAKKRIT